MSRLFNQAIDQATGDAAQLFAGIKKAVGMVPNAYATIGNNSPLALQAVLTLEATLGKSSLSAKDREIIKLAVSEDASCTYCLAAHTLFGQKAGLSTEQTIAIRHGQPSGDAKADALASFVHTLATTRGDAPTSAVDAVRAAGYTDQQIVDILLTMSSINFTNLFNRVNATELDFPAAP
ncbi:MAG TPA: carboxymuconolactone decarboxylase family protein [Pseudoduganella sp.]